MSEPSVEDDFDKDAARTKERLTYLIEMYKLYHGHINTMFNFFIILSGLIANACIISLQRQAAINKLVPASIGIFGFVISLVLLLVHRRSRELIDLLEKGLEQEENSLFGIDRGFVNVHHRRFWFSRHRYQFRIIYCAFMVGFVLIAIYAIFGAS